MSAVSGFFPSVRLKEVNVSAHIEPREVNAQAGLPLASLLAFAMTCFRDSASLR